MKLKTLSHLSIASAVSLACLSTPMVAQSATSADVSIANMYLWRGLDVSAASAQVSGTLKYSHASGFYAGGWTSSVWAGLGQEVDLFLGYGGEAGGVGYDISYWNYLYPEDGAIGAGLDSTNNEEVVLGLSYDMFSFGAYINVDSDTADDNYYTLGVAKDQYSLTYGMWEKETPNTVDQAGDEYSHLTFGFAATDELMFKLSVASSDNGFTEEDPLVQIVYSKSFDL